MKQVLKPKLHPRYTIVIMAGVIVGPAGVALHSGGEHAWLSGLLILSGSVLMASGPVLLLRFQVDCLRQRLEDLEMKNVEA